MKNTVILTLLILIFHPNSYAQQNLDIVLTTVLDNGKSLDGIKKELDSVIEDWLPYANIKRELIQNHSEIVQNFFSTNGDEYLIRIQGNKNYIYLKSITKWNVQENYKKVSLFSEIDSIEYKKYLYEFQNIHNINKNLDSNFEIYQFGEYCGIVGMPPGITSKLIKLIEDKQVSKLNDWLYSINAEVQLCGAIGLKILTKYNDVNFGNETKKIIERLEDRPTLINMCEGCFVGVRKPMKELLHEDYIDIFYERMINKE